MLPAFRVSKVAPGIALPNVCHWKDTAVGEVAFRVTVLSWQKTKSGTPTGVIVRVGEGCTTTVSVARAPSQLPTEASLVWLT